MSDPRPPSCTCAGPQLQVEGHRRRCPWWGIPLPTGEQLQARADRRSRPRRTAEQQDEFDQQVIENYEDDARAEALRRLDERYNRRRNGVE